MQQIERGKMSVCVCLRERVCVCVCLRERGCVCVCVFVCLREKEKLREIKSSRPNVKKCFKLSWPTQKRSDYKQRETFCEKKIVLITQKLRLATKSNSIGSKKIQ